MQRRKPSNFLHFYVLLRSTFYLLQKRLCLLLSWYARDCHKGKKITKVHKGVSRRSWLSWVSWLSWLSGLSGLCRGCQGCQGCRGCHGCRGVMGVGPRSSVLYPLSSVIRHRSSVIRLRSSVKLRKHSICVAIRIGKTLPLYTPL